MDKYMSPHFYKCTIYSIPTTDDVLIGRDPYRNIFGRLSQFNRILDSIQDIRLKEEIINILKRNEEHTDHNITVICKSCHSLITGDPKVLRFHLDMDLIN